MRIGWIVGAMLIGLCAGATPAAAQERDCRDDTGVDRCSAEQQRRVRELFGAESLEALRDAGAQVRRAFYVDGYGRDLIAIEFVRAPGVEPTLFVRFPRRRGEPATPPLQAVVPERVWEEVLFRTALFERLLAPAAGEDICMHAWVYTVEAIDPPRPGSHAPPPAPRVRTEDACGDGLAHAAAVELQRAAISLLPACAALDPAQHRNEATRLAACRLLRGDRLAAAKVMNRARPFLQARDPADAAQLGSVFDSRATVDWNGQVHRQDGGADDFWLAHLESAGRPSFFLDEVEGIDAFRVRLKARLVQQPEQGPAAEAPVEQHWVFTPAQEYQIERVTVGPFRPARRP